MTYYHLVGIGGIGMSGIAKLLKAKGNVVSGSDIKESKIIQELRKEGIDVFIGHSSKNIRDNVEVIVYSSAIQSDNPEIQEAHRRGLVILKRAQALAELMQGSTNIVVTGSHGKTTTTSLVAHLLSFVGFMPTVAVGGILKDINKNAYLGKGDFFVAEADESDGSFLCYSPTYSIITNIDYEHLDYYQRFDNLIATFKEFISKTKRLVFACGDDPNLREILKVSKKCLFFGLNPRYSDFYPSCIKNGVSYSEFDLFYKDRFVDHFRINLLGTHNISNSLAVIALGLELNIDREKIKSALDSFSGVRRRIEIKYVNKEYTIIDDYAHHPTEIKATLEAIKNFRRKRIIAIFQPHRYTRTKLLLNEFSKVFEPVDILIITDIYAAGESPIEGISSSVLYEKIRENQPQKNVIFLKKDEIVDFILRISQPDDLIITLGAGDITQVSDVLSEKFREKV